MLQSMCKTALLTSLALVIATGSASAQNGAGLNSNSVIAGNSGPQSNTAQGAGNSGAANSGAASQQSKLTPDQIKQQIQAEMARMAKDMIASFDQNGDKALNETELQEALVALTNMMRGNNNQQPGNANNNKSMRGQAFNRTGTNNTGTGNVDPNSVPASGQPSNSNSTSQRIGRRR